MIRCKEFSVLRSRRHFVINRIKDIERKKKILKGLNGFIADVKTSGLTKDKWDRFPVTIKDRFLSFPELGRTLALTDNSDLYYFKPSFLHIRINNSDVMSGHKVVSHTSSAPVQIPSDGLNTDVRQVYKADDTHTLKNPEGSKRGDMIMTLKGFFLIRKR